jgi:hypothetical protein
LALLQTKQISTLTPLLLTQEPAQLVRQLKAVTRYKAQLLALLDHLLTKPTAH